MKNTKNKTKRKTITKNNAENKTTNKIRQSISFYITTVSFLLAVASIWYTYEISRPIDLKVWSNINERNNRLEVYARNNEDAHFFSSRFLNRTSGTIYFYRLEKNGFKPHMQTGPIGPGETQIFNLSINISKKNVNVPFDNPKVKCTIPAVKLYFITEKTSISYKITCDNCAPQGIIERIPKFGNIQFELGLNLENRTCILPVPVYSWVDFELEDLDN